VDGGKHKVRIPSGASLQPDDALGDDEDYVTPIMCAALYPMMVIRSHWVFATVLLKLLMPSLVSGFHDLRTDLQTLWCGSYSLTEVVS
jgi:type II secretory pathway component PulF